MCSEPTCFGLCGSETSYWRISPVPQQDAYKNRSSSERSMSVNSGGTALKPFSSGGNNSGSAGSAGISITFFKLHFPLSRVQSQMDEERSFSETTTPTNP